jgi:hypothetical protein
LYARLGGWVHQQVSGVTEDVLAAELVTVGVFARVWRRPDEFDQDNLRPTLARLARTRAREWTDSVDGTRLTLVPPPVDVDFEFDADRPED